MLPLQLLDAVGSLTNIAVPAALADFLRSGVSNVDVLGYEVCAGATAAAAGNVVNPFSLVFGEHALLDDHEREAERLAFVLSRRVLPVAASVDALLCIDAASGREADLPIRLYEPEYFHEGNPDFIRWTESTGAKLGPSVVSSFARLVALADCARRTDDDGWGGLGEIFARTDPEGAGTEAGRAFWENALRLHARRTAEPTHWRRWVSVLGAGVDVQLALYPMAQRATTERQFELAMKIAETLTAPELRVQGRIVRAKALAALSRHAENEREVLSLARAWLAPAAPLSPNQLMDRAEMLELLRPFRSLRAHLLRLRVMVAPTPPVVI
jgi:hypothetical protein